MDLIELFDARCCALPEENVICFKDRWISSRELHVEVERIASLISALDMPPASLIGISMGRTPRLIAALFAIAKLGHVFCPLDRSVPISRYLQAMGESRPSVLLYDGVDPNWNEFKDRFHVVDSSFHSLGSERQSPRVSGCLYVMHTSGSTGVPRAVPITRIAVQSYFDSLKEIVPLGKDDCVLAHTSVTFDPAMRELLYPIVCGSRVSLLDEVESRNPAEVLRQLRENNITAITAMIPSFLKRLLEWSDTPIKNTLRWLLVSGEPFSGNLLSELTAKFGEELSVFNMYGTTETTLTSTSHLCVPEDCNRDRISVGKAISGNRVRLRQENQIADRSVGEIVIQGKRVFSGYLSEDAHSQNRLHILDGEREFLTGDLGFVESGELYLLGRSDRQLKIRGIRTDPLEIEQIFCSHPSIRDAVAVAYPSLADAASIELVVHLRLNDGATWTREQKDSVESKLPPHLRPVSVLIHEVFPINRNTKTDYSELERLWYASNSSGAASNAHLTGNFENLASIFQRTIGKELLDFSTTFLQAGGDSLSIIDFSLNLKRSFGVSLSIDLLSRASFIEIANALMSQSASTPLPTIRSTQPKAALDCAKTQRINPHREPSRIVITGATGFVGAFILAEFRTRMPDVPVVALCRGSSDASASNRLQRALSSYGLNTQHIMSNTTCFRSDIRLQNLGLPKWLHDDLADTTDVVVHSAAWVNHMYAYELLEETNVNGTTRCVSFAMTGKQKLLIHISSHTSNDGDNALVSGYDRSKNESERILVHYSASGLQSAIFRPCRLFSSRKSGAVNLRDLLMQIVLSSLWLNSVPRFIHGTRLLYVDDFATHVADTSLLMLRNGQSSLLEDNLGDDVNIGELIFSALRSRSGSIRFVPISNWEVELQEKLKTGCPDELNWIRALSLEGSVLRKLTSSQECAAYDSTHEVANSQIEAVLAFAEKQGWIASILQHR